jgi:hypothetical protein
MTASFRGLSPFEIVKTFGAIYDNRPNPTDHEYADDHKSERTEIIIQTVNDIPHRPSKVQLIFNESGCFDTSDNERNDH